MQTARTWDDISPIIKETGIAPVDHDHRRLTEYTLELNDLLLEMEQDFNLELISQQRQLLDQFILYTHEHFAREENFIKKYNIPGLERQEQEHKRILKMLDEIIFEFKTGRISSAFRLRLQLLNWVINHVNTTDYEVFDFINICEAIIKVDNWKDIRGFIRKVHVPTIDREHKELTEAIMEVGQSIRAFQSGKTERGDLILEKLKKAIKLTSLHFSHEIEIIRKYQIEGKDIQKEQHKGFLAYLVGQKDILEQKRYDKLGELERELLFWWIQHINIYDYTTFMKTEWISNVFALSDSPEEVFWLINPTGIDSVDRDHQIFVEMLFNLKFLSFGPESEAADRKETIEEMKTLINYARTHFRSEETIMAENNMESLERHRKEHNRIIGSLNEHLYALENDLIDLSGQLRSMLLQWWIDHTNGFDYDTFGAVYES